MNTVSIPFVLIMIYWIYLLDPFSKNFHTRNYIRLFTNIIYLLVNAGFGVLLIITKLCLDDSFKEKIFPASLPLLFILTSLLLNFISVIRQKRFFKLVLRGDSFSYSFMDGLFSLLLMAMPVFLSFVTDLKYLQ